MEAVRRQAPCGVPVVLLLAVLLPAATGCGSGGGLSQDGPAAAAEPSELDELAWIAGYWTGEKGGARIEELWMQPRSTTMLGLHRDLLPDGEVVFEYLRIENTGDGPVYWASPMGGPATEFTLVDSGHERAVFENETHDFPQRIIYWKDRGRLRARIEGEVAGESHGLEWEFRPATAPAPAPRPAAPADDRDGE